MIGRSSAGANGPVGIQPDTDVAYQSGIQAGYGEGKTDARCHLEMFGYGSAVSRAVCCSRDTELNIIERRKRSIVSNRVIGGDGLR